MDTKVIRRRIKLFLEFAQRLGKIDSSLSLRLRYGKGILTVEVYNEGLGDIYTYSSGNVLDVYKRVDKFISCLEDKDSTSLFKLLDEILNEPLEV